MTRKTTESYGKNADRAQTERRLKSEEVSLSLSVQTLRDVF